jgi:hypothetical protein
MRGWHKISERCYERDGWAPIRSAGWSALGPVENSTSFATAYLRNESLSIRRFGSTESAARAVDVELERRAKEAPFAAPGISNLAAT